MKSIHVRRLESLVATTAARLVAYATQHQVPVADLQAVRLPWYTIRGQDNGSAGTGGREDEAPTVFIFDTIGGSLGVSAKQFAADLQAIDAPLIRVRINSPGGSVFDAIAIHSALLHHRARIQVFVDGYAASAASVVAMAGDEVVMMPGSQMMIHDASMVEDGNERDHKAAATFLGRESDNIAGMYQRRAGGDVAEWRALMLEETWMFADEAVQMGLADRTEHARTPDDDDDLDDRMTRSFDLSGFRYAGRRAAPAPTRRAAADPADSGADRKQRTHAVVPRRRAEAAADRKAAAQARAAGAAGIGYRTSRYRASRDAKGTRANMPAGYARSLPFPAQLSATLEKRNGQDMYHLFGQASVFDVSYEMWDEFGPYDEQVDRHAADETLAANPDVAFLVNHRGVTMARTTNGTLELAASDGLDVDAWMNPKRQDVSGVLIPAVQDGNVTEMSFAFLLEEGQWNQDFTIFRIMRFDIHRGDVSAVNYGANPYTSIAARQREILAELESASPELARPMMARLLGRSDLDLDDLFRRHDVARQYETARATLTAPAEPREDAPRGRSIAHIEALLLDV